MVSVVFSMSTAFFPHLSLLPDKKSGALTLAKTERGVDAGEVLQRPSPKSNVTNPSV